MFRNSAVVAKRTPRCETVVIVGYNHLNTWTTFGRRLDDGNSIGSAQLPSTDATTTGMNHPMMRVRDGMKSNRPHADRVSEREDSMRVDHAAPAVISVVIGIVFAWIIMFSGLLADRSWGSLQIAFLFSPMVNLSIALIALLISPLVRGRFPNASLFCYAMVSILRPLVATATLIVAVLLMDLRGC